MKIEMWKFFVGSFAVLFPLFYFIPGNPSGMIEADRNLPKFEILNEEGKITDIRDILTGTDHLVYFGYLNCKSICHGSLAKLKDLISEHKELKLAFVSLDPEKDSTERFRSYFSNSNIKPLFIRTESRGQSFELARSFGIQAFSSNNSADIDHPDSLLWVNSHGKIKGIFFEFNKHWNQNRKELLKFISDNRN
ncbi:SCO family protein [Leptospira sarikeiensis]|uniref:SCO family protein n=2 Tax=Leptospira sarikeiensis TaxID=2484943 RepID=A0A4R9KD36_9LEPT|nr:SCO family protein [Leptospira sarikeiensis]